MTDHLYTLADLDRVFDAALEAAAAMIAGYTTAHHISQDMKSGIFPSQSPKREAMAASIRALKDDAALRAQITGAGE